MIWNLLRLKAINLHRFIAFLKIKLNYEIFYCKNMNLNDIGHNINNMHKSLLRLANYFDGNEIAPFDELNIVSSNHFQKDLLNTKNEVSSEIKSREESIESRL